MPTPSTSMSTPCTLVVGDSRSSSHLVTRLMNTDDISGVEKTGTLCLSPPRDQLRRHLEAARDHDRRRLERAQRVEPAAARLRRRPCRR